MKQTITALVASTVISQGAVIAYWEYEDTMFSIGIEDGGAQIGEVFYFGVDVKIRAIGGDAMLLQGTFGFHDRNVDPTADYTLLKTMVGDYDAPHYSTDGYETIVDFYDKFKVESKTFSPDDELNLFFKGQTELDVDINAFAMRVVDNDGFGINQADVKVFYNSGYDSVALFQQAPSPVEFRFNAMPIPEPSTALLTAIAALGLIRRKR
ncbi:MAG: PEP-CTERM sorting domain-containing protein [Candidatus Thorarchaeota archaeon]|jgi:hypothetical protein